MSVHLSRAMLKLIEAHGESHYPEEGAGLILGEEFGERREARQMLPLENRREDGARSHRYQIDPLDTLAAEDRADALGLQIIGVFHSHPDHPAVPSQTDLFYAVPWYSYLITSVRGGRAQETRAWRLDESQSEFEEEPMELVPQAEPEKPAAMAPGTGQEDS